jgi:hypothetical protein
VFSFLSHDALSFLSIPLTSPYVFLLTLCIQTRTVQSLSPASLSTRTSFFLNTYTLQFFLYLI